MIALLSIQPMSANRSTKARIASVTAGASWSISAVSTAKSAAQPAKQEEVEA
jgi:hypothetical protein